MIKKAKLALLSSSKVIKFKAIKNNMKDIEFKTIKFISKLFDYIPLKKEQLIPIFLILFKN